MSIPVMDLPKQLVTLLTATLEDNVTKNWTIYSDYNGDVVFKIRFEAMDSINHDGQVVHAPTSHFKRKTEGQVKRDQQRSQKWRDIRGNQQHQRINLSDSGTGVRTRSQNRDVSSTPEQMRGNDDASEVPPVHVSSLLQDTPSPHSRDELIDVNNVCDPHVILYSDLTDNVEADVASFLPLDYSIMANECKSVSGNSIASTDGTNLPSSDMYVSD